MRSSRVFLGIILATLVVGIVVGIAWSRRGAATTESATGIVQKAKIEQAKVLAALGPNTTLHSVSTSFQEGASKSTTAFAVPDITISEGSITFDSSGHISAYSGVKRGEDGHVYQRTELVGGNLVTTDLASGETVTSLNNVSAMTADTWRTKIEMGLQRVASLLTPSDKVQVGQMLDGNPVFLIQTTTSRSYIDKMSFLPLREEQLAPDGHVVSYSMPTVFEVLPASASTATPSAIASVTPTASATVAAPTPTP